MTTLFVEDILKEGNFGLAMKREDVLKYPVEDICKGEYSVINVYMLPFVIVNNLIVFQKGTYLNNFSEFKYLANSTPDWDKDVKSNYVITHVFPYTKALSFNGVINTLISWERYGLPEHKPTYISPFLPKVMTQKQIEEILGYKIYIIDN